MTVFELLERYHIRDGLGEPYENPGGVCDISKSSP